MKTLELHNIIIVIRSVSNDGKRYYLHIFLNACSYKLAAKIQMLENDSINVSREIDTNKIGTSRVINGTLTGQILDFKQKYATVLVI